MASISAHSSLAVENTGWHYLRVSPDNFDCSNANFIGYKDRYFVARVSCNEPNSDDDCEVQLGVPELAGDKILWPEDFTDEEAFDWRSNHYGKDEHWDDAGLPWVHVTGKSLGADTEYFRAEILFDDVPVHENSLNIRSEGSDLVAMHSHAISFGAHECNYEVYIEGHDAEGDCETWIKYDAKYIESGETITHKNKECFNMG